MKNRILLVVSIVLSIGTQAQNMFSVSSQHPAADTLLLNSREQALRYPGLRQASVTATVFGSGHFDSRLNNKDLASGNSENVRISSFFNVPLGKWNGNVLRGTIYHNAQFFHIRDVSNALTEPQLSNGHIRKSTIGLSLNFSRTGRLFKAPVIYSAVFTAISDNLSSVKRFNFNGSLIFPIRHTADAYLAIGVLVLIDPSAPLPVLPTVNYVRRLSGSGLQLILDLPQSLTLKQPVSQKAWIYLGTQANTFTSFYRSGNPSLPERFSYNTIEFKNGVGFEYLLGKLVILGISGGLNGYSSVIALAKGDHYNDAFIKSTNKATPYGEFNISLLPF
jgi:hypothetical protein